MLRSELPAIDASLSWLDSGTCCSIHGEVAFVLLVQVLRPTDTNLVYATAPMESELLSLRRLCCDHLY